jgi:pilus assembly protein CpaB
MTRQTRTLIVVAVAVVAAAIASYGTYRALSRVPERRVEMPTKKTVVAAKQMPLGTLITRDAVKVVDWPAQTPLQGGFSSIDEVVDRGLITSVVENEPISENKLSTKEAGAGLAPTISQGMRAISIRVNEVIGVAGFVLPGSRVDVVVILANKSSLGGGDTFSRVVVSNVPVLTAGTRYDQEESRTDAKAIRSSVVTLMVSPVDAERIALAQSQGELVLTLRHPLDVAPTEDNRGVRMAGLFTGSDEPAPKPASAPAVRRAIPPSPPPPPVAPVVKAYTVETIRAAKRSEETLLGGYVAR